jgi:riboflavin kinase / FMN adenylyltransferase
MDPQCSFTGEVQRGNRIGRTLGFPTINLKPGAAFLEQAKEGVYAARVQWNHRLMPGMAYLGFRPTIESKELLLEVNLFDFSEEIYGETVTVLLYDFIRGDRKFNGLEELKTAIEKDRARVLECLSMGR